LGCPRSLRQVDRAAPGGKVAFEGSVVKRFDITIIGGGIIGLATAREVTRRHPAAKVALLEKEDRLAAHQTGHNSGVIHSGIYYRPGSLKAKTCVGGARALVAFCQEQGVPHEICGKVVVATREEELSRLDELLRRGTANGVDGLELIGRERLRDLEPGAAGLGALHVPGTGIVDFGRVAHGLARVAEQQGAEIRTGHHVRNVVPDNGGLVVETASGEVPTRYLVNCGGLHADRLARMAGAEPTLQIVPFRGEYYRLEGAARLLVRNLIYPVPDPAFPFLGVHFTRTITGVIEAGPNAVLAFAREGYERRNVSPRDLWETLSYRGFWRMAVRYWRTGAGEFYRSLRRRAFVNELRRLVPEVGAEQLSFGGSGVRAQAVSPQGLLVDDFVVQAGPRAVHVLNAPSPAATASLAVARLIVDEAARVFSLER